MSSAVARPIRSSSKKFTSSTWFIPRVVKTKNGANTGGQGDGLATVPYRLDLVDAADAFVGATREVDAELFRSTEDFVVGLAHLQGRAVAGEHLNIEAQ